MTAFIFLLKGEVLTHKTSLKPPIFIEVPMLIQVCEQLCVLKVSSLPLCTIFLLNFGNVPTLRYLLFGFGNEKLNIIRYR